MTDSSTTSASYLSDALHTLGTHGRVTVPGRISDPYLRLKRRLTIMTIVFISIFGAGLIGVVASILLYNHGPWAPLIGIGLPLAIAGLVCSITTVIVLSTLTSRLRADHLEPVTLGPEGMCLRGIGPIPWTDVLPPQFLPVRTRGDINGVCAVMPLTPQGYSRVNSLPYSQAHLIGPRWYFRPYVPYLMLPGVTGLSEADTNHLFGVAYEMFSPDRDLRPYRHS